MKTSFSPPLPELKWLEPNTPYSEQFGDRYYSRDGGQQETQWVFLKGNNVLARWKEKQNFVIGELGFGSGLNFLVTWKTWLESAGAEENSPQRLDYISFEKYPLAKTDIGRILANWPELGDLPARLLSQLPIRLNGFHRLHFDNVTLTLVYGDAADALPELMAQVDAWYLDGFSPAKNPELWQGELLLELSKKSAPGATVATYSVARAVVEALTAAGFSVNKQQGFGSKSDMLVGALPSEQTLTKIPTKFAPRVAVIGAGLAGTAVCRNLSQQNCEITLYEQAADIAQGASGNPVGILMPHLSASPDYLTRVAVAAFDYVLRELRALSDTATFHQTGVVRLATSSRLQNLYEILPTLGIAADFAECLNAEEISRRFQLNVKLPGIFFPQGGWLSPPELCRANLQAAGRTEVRLRTAIHSLQRRNNCWQLFDAAKNLMSEVDAVVLCGGYEMQNFPSATWLPLERVRGQVMTIKSTPALSKLRTSLCYDGYLSPEHDGVHMLGATFDHGNNSPVVDDVQNTEMLSRLFEVAEDFEREKAEVSSARVGFRTMSRDRLPMVGELPDLENFETEYRALRLQELPRQGRLPGLYINTGFGSRGILWSHFCAELISCLIFDRPLPLEKELVEALDPARYPARLIRQGISPTPENLEKLKAPFAKKSAQPS